MKKILAVLMAVLMVASLAACGGKTSAPATEAAPAPAADNTTAAAETTAPEQSLIDAAKAEGELVVYGSCEEEYLAAACEHFEELYGIKVQYQRLRFRPRSRKRTAILPLTSGSAAPPTPTTSSLLRACWKPTRPRTLPTCWAASTGIPTATGTAFTRASWASWSTRMSWLV